MCVCIYIYIYAYDYIYIIYIYAYIYIFFVYREATSLFWKQGRIKTFNNWSFTISDKCNRKYMAATGFYAIGNSNEPDLIEYFICINK